MSVATNLKFNCNLWKDLFTKSFALQLQGIVASLENRLLPNFFDIEEEAKSVTKATWDAFMSSPSSGDEDPSDFAEAAEQAGASHYILLKGLCQGMINLFAAALYQTFEQQAMLFLRYQVLQPDETNNINLFKMSILQKRMKVAGIKIDTFSSWNKIDELRLLANTVKHAEGNSAQKLHLLRHDLFEHPQVLGLTLDSTPHIFLPLAGEGLYVSVTDVRQYCDSLLLFWEELFEAMKNA